MIKKRGFKLDGITSQSKGLILPVDPQIYYPSKSKVKERITGTNEMIDVGSSILGIEQYNERRIKITINILNYNKVDIFSTQRIAMDVMNWLMEPSGKRRLELDIIPGYYFEAELEDGNDFETNLLEFGIAEVYFTCYPFRKTTYNVGDDIFRYFDFKEGRRQKTDFRLPGLETVQLPYKKLEVGDVVNLSGWAQSYGGSSVGKVTRYMLMQNYTITEVRTSTTNTDPNIYDKTLYQLNNGMVVWAQDIMQSVHPYVEVNLYNGGVTRVIPDILIGVWQNTSYWQGVTIEKDGRMYPMKRSAESGIRTTNNTIFTLDPGDNKIKIYGVGTRVIFNYEEEKL